MRKTFIYLLFTFLLSSCSVKSEHIDRTEEEALVKECIDISRKYIDSLSIARDSTAVNALINNYEAAITRINYAHTPDLYLNLRESENDSISRLALRIVAIRDSLLYRYSHPLPAPSLLRDSIPTDSIQPM